MEILFDVIIYFFLGSVGLYLIHKGHYWKETKRHRFSVALFVLLAVSWSVIFYGSFIEPRMLVVRQETVQLTQQPTKTIRAVLFSDLHVGPFKKQDWAARVVQRVMALEPDIIFMSGDFVVTSAKDTTYLAPLRNLRATYGVYAVTGNHEYHADAAPEVIQVLKDAGITVIENEMLDVDIAGQILRIAGVSDIWFDGDLEKTMQEAIPQQTIILLAHNPDVLLDPVSRGADLVLAGHTHGGQIRLPWIGPVPSLPTKLGRAYDEGWFLFDQTKLFITSGVGESGTRARLFNLPEIIQMDIQF